MTVFRSSRGCFVDDGSFLTFQGRPKAEKRATESQILSLSRT